MNDAAYDRRWRKCDIRLNLRKHERKSRGRKEFMWSEYISVVNTYIYIYI